MLKSYLVVALRTLSRNPVYATVSIVGLAAAIAVCLLVITYVLHETSYDRFHPHADRLYRVSEEARSRNQAAADRNATHTAYSGYYVGPVLQDNVPEVIDYARFSKPLGMPGEEMWFEMGEERFYEDSVLYATPGALRLFAFPLSQGDPETALSSPWQAVISQAVAQKYFGGEDPLGKTLSIRGEEDVKITGVFAPLPKNTHIRFNVLLSYNGEHVSYGRTYSYVRLAEGADADLVRAKLPAIARTHLDNEFYTHTLFLEPVTRIHLHSDLREKRFAGASTEIARNGSIDRVYLFCAIAALVLIIACANYANLATSRTIYRAREVGLRVVAGARRRDLLIQFMTESLLISLAALLIGGVLATLLLPLFSSTFMVEIPVTTAATGAMALLSLMLVIVVALFAGIYPALHLSRLDPTLTLRGLVGSAGSRGTVRKTLVVFQFAISAVLIVATFIVEKQLSHIRDQQLGFEKEQRVVLHGTSAVGDRYEALKTELLSLPGVRRVATSSTLPPKVHAEMISDASHFEGAGREGEVVMELFDVDADFVETLDIEMTKGRDFSDEFPSDANAALINATGAAYLGWSDPVGKEAVDKKIIGVVEDFYFSSRRREVKPAFFELVKGASRYIIIEVDGQNIPETLQRIRATWNELLPLPFHYSFLEDDFDSLYRSEEGLARMFTLFAILSIFISCLGLFGVAAYAASRRTKEVAVRRVLGATMSQIVTLLSKEFVLLVCVALGVAFPVAFLLMRRWLDGFAFRIELGPLAFLLAGALVLLAAFVAVAYQSVKLSLVDPAKNLRQE